MFLAESQWHSSSHSASVSVISQLVSLSVIQSVSFYSLKYRQSLQCSKSTSRLKESIDSPLIRTCFYIWFSHSVFAVSSLSVRQFSRQYHQLSQRKEGSQSFHQFASPTFFPCKVQLVLTRGTVKSINARAD